MSKKIISVLLALTLALGCCSALAENTKHERVYVVTKPDGTVKSITDNIRLENTDGLEELIDRTMLTSIENLGGKESFVLDGETLTWQAKGNDISYQGTSEKTPVILPIVHLTLDGQEISAEELKDKTGEAVLTISYQMTESLPVLAVTDYKVNRGARPVIAEPISFTLKEGDIAILEAPNGWGKSTLLESVAGLVPAAAGKVELQGEDVTALPVWKRARKGLRLNRAAGTLFTQATVQENARLNHVAEPILPALSDRKAGSLSGGESRRLSFEAVLNNPEAKILMLDEPFQALDITESARVRRSLSNSQKTILVTVPICSNKE